MERDEVFVGQQVTLTGPYTVAGGDAAGDWWGKLPLGTVGIIQPLESGRAVDGDNDALVLWDHYDADRPQYCGIEALSGLKLPPEFNPDTIEKFLEDT